MKWLKSFQSKLIFFLRNQSCINKPGYHKYSYSGDLWTSDKHWNLASAVFAAKLYYWLGNPIDHQLSKTLDYIMSFHNNNGYIYDPLLFRRSFLRNAIYNIKIGNYSDINNHKIKLAETKQSYAALSLHNKLPDIVYLDYPKSKEAIHRYLNQLPWQKPWGAGSHFSNLIFMLELAKKTNKLSINNYQLLTNSAYTWLQQQQKPDGSWYSGNPSDVEKVNGAMKIVTAFISSQTFYFHKPKALIDLCLCFSETHANNACCNFNIILILHYASKHLNNAYRFDDICKFMQQRLLIYQQFYHPDTGGFSFYPNKANTMLYGARITKGLNEPDIHATNMFTMGLSIISKTLCIPELNLRSFREI